MSTFEAVNVFRSAATSRQKQPIGYKATASIETKNAHVDLKLL